MSDLRFPLNALHVCKDLAETNVTVQLRAEVAHLQAERAQEENHFGRLFKCLGQDPFFGVVLSYTVRNVDPGSTFAKIQGLCFELDPEKILGECPRISGRRSYDRNDWEIAADILELAGYDVDMTFATETDNVPEKIFVSLHITEQ